MRKSCFNFLYGLIACLFYAAYKTWEQNFRGFAAALVRAEAVNLGLALNTLYQLH